MFFCNLTFFWFLDQIKFESCHCRQLLVELNGKWRWWWWGWRFVWHDDYDDDDDDDDKGDTDDDSDDDDVDDDAFGRSCMLETDWGHQEKAVAHFTPTALLLWTAQMWTAQQFTSIMWTFCTSFQLHCNSLHKVHLWITLYHTSLKWTALRLCTASNVFFFTFALHCIFDHWTYPVLSQKSIF